MEAHHNPLAIRDHCEFLRRCILQQNGLCIWIMTIIDLLVVLFGQRQQRIEAALALGSLLISIWVSQSGLERSLNESGRAMSVQRNLWIRCLMWLACILSALALLAYCLGET